MGATFGVEPPEQKVLKCVILHLWRVYITFETSRMPQVLYAEVEFHIYEPGNMNFFPLTLLIVSQEPRFWPFHVWFFYIMKILKKISLYEQEIFWLMFVCNFICTLSYLGNYIYSDSTTIYRTKFVYLPWTKSNLTNIFSWITKIFII